MLRVRRLIVAVLILALVSYVLWDQLETRGLRRDVAAIAARGEPVTVDDPESVVLTTEQRDAARIYATAAERVQDVARDDASRYLRLDVDNPVNQPGTLEELEARYRQDAPALQLLDQATPLDFREFGDVAPDLYTNQEPLASLNALNAVRADLLSMRGRGDQAADVLVASVRLLRTMPRSYYRGQASRRLLGSVHILIRNASPPEASLAKLQQAFESLPDTDTLTHEMLQARAEFIELVSHPSSTFGDAVSARIMRPVRTRDTRRHLAAYDEALDRGKEDGRRVAKALYGASGFVMHHNTDLWGHAVPIDQAGSGMWPMGAAWLSLHLWDHYDYTRDARFLRERGYPTMKEAAEFLLDYMVTDAQARLITGPSLSPENRYRLPDGTTARVCMGPAMDTQIVHALFTRLIRSSEILGVDPEFRARLTAARSKLPPIAIGKHGQIQEWLEDYDEQDPGHRHISQLFALSPGNQITPRGTPALARAAKATLDRRLAHGGGHTGWSRAWIINFWARLEEAQLAYDNVVALLAKSTLPNMLDTHPPFQIDGNFGGATGIAEMLLQSHAGEIALLPALPAALPDGVVTGLQARGAVGVDISWSNGKATRAILRPRVAGVHVIRAPRSQQVAEIREGGRLVTLVDTADAVRARLAAGRAYAVTFRDR